MLYSKHVCQFVQTLLSCLALIDNNSVIHIATLYQVSLQQWFYITNKYKSTCRSNFCSKILYFVDCGKLRINKFRFKRAHNRKREFVVGQDGDNRSCLLVFYFNFLADDVPVFGCVLLFYTYFFNFLNIFYGRTVENWEFRTVNLNHTVVNS